MKKGMRKTIYIKDAGIWLEIKAEAKKLDRSISWYLVDCHKNQKARRGGFLAGIRKESGSEKFESDTPSEHLVLRNGNEEIASESDKLKKVKKVIAKSSHSEFFNPQPKSEIK